MATIKFLLQGKKDPANIVVLLSLGRGKQFKRLTGKEISPSNWKVDQPSKDKKVIGRAGMPKQTDVELKNLHTDLEAFRVELRKLVNEAVQRAEDVNGGWLETAIDKINDTRPVEDLDLLTNILSKRIKNEENGKGKLSVNRIKGLKTFRTVIHRYEKEGLKGRKIVIRHIDKDFGDSFIEWLLGKGYSVGYTAKNIDNLKAICNYAEKKGVQVSPRLKYIESPKQDKNEYEEEKPIVILSEQEQEKIKELKLVSPALENARKWLLLGCMIGQRGGDLLNITEDDIVEVDGRKLIEIRQIKTKKNVSIPVLPQALQVIESGIPYKISIQKFNQYIKDLCRLAEIDEPTPGSIRPSQTEEEIAKTGRRVLPSVKGVYPKYQLIGSHVCRRSFATNFYGKIPTALLIGITGHSTESMFLKYINKAPREKALEMFKKYEKLKEKAKNKSSLKVVKGASNG